MIDYFGRSFNIAEKLPNIETIKAQQFAALHKKVSVPGKTMTLELLMQNMN